MLNDISLALRNKIRKELTVPNIYSDNYYIGNLSFKNNETDLYKECKEWCEIIETYFSTSYTSYCLKNIGRFHYVRPHFVKENEVLFEIESFDPPSWKDWFDDEGKNDGPLLGSVGIVINERTSKYASK